MADWSDILQVGKFGGVEFDFVRSARAGSNTIDKQAFPNKKGRYNVGRGDDGDTFDVLAIFIEDDYPGKMNELIAQLKDGGGPKEFVDPVFGTIKASCDRWTVTHDVEDAADSATIQITFSEHTDESAGTQAVTTTTAAKANAVRSYASDVLVALSEFQAATEIQNNEYVLQVTAAANAATSIADSLEATADDLSALEIQATTNQTLSIVDESVQTGADYDSTEGYDLAQLILRMSAAISDLANGLIETKPPLQEFTVPATTNLLAWVHDLVTSGAISSDADEVLQLNSIEDPSEIRAGVRLLAYGN